MLQILFDLKLFHGQGVTFACKNNNLGALRNGSLTTASWAPDQAAFDIQFNKTSCIRSDCEGYACFVPNEILSSDKAIHIAFPNEPQQLRCSPPHDQSCKTSHYSNV